MYFKKIISEFFDAFLLFTISGLQERMLILGFSGKYLSSFLCLSVIFSLSE